MTTLYTEEVRKGAIAFSEFLEQAELESSRQEHACPNLMIEEKF